MNHLPTSPLVIFDGVCNFCNSSINFVMDHEPGNQVKFTPFQGKTGAAVLKHFGKDPENVHTLYFLEAGKLYEKSTAVLRITGYLETPWRWAYAFILIPAFLRNLVYNWIAINRYNLFGKKDACRIPTPEERARFLD